VENDFQPFITPMKKKLLVLGCGAHGRVLVETAELTGLYEPVGFADDNPEKVGKTILGLPVLADWTQSGADVFVVGIGHNGHRAKFFDRLREAGAEVVALVHPAAFVSRHATLRRGSVVLAGGVVQSGAVVGSNVIVNIGAVVDHDAQVGDHAHLAPNSTVASFGKVGAGETLPHGQLRSRSSGA